MSVDVKFSASKGFMLAGGFVRRVTPGFSSLKSVMDVATPLAYRFLTKVRSAVAASSASPAFAVLVLEDLWARSHPTGQCVTPVRTTSKRQIPVSTAAHFPPAWSVRFLNLGYSDAVHDVLDDRLVPARNVADIEYSLCRPMGRWHAKNASRLPPQLVVPAGESSPAVVQRNAKTVLGVDISWPR